MEYEIIPSQFFLEQIDDLSNEAANLIEKKLRLTPIDLRESKATNFSYLGLDLKTKERKKELSILSTSQK